MCGASEPSHTNTTPSKLLCYACICRHHPLKLMIPTFISIVQIWGWCHLKEEELKTRMDI